MLVIRYLTIAIFLSLLVHLSATTSYAAPLADLTIIKSSARLKEGQLKFKIRNLNNVDISLRPDRRLVVRLQWLGESGEETGTPLDLDITDSTVSSGFYFNRSNGPNRSYVINAFYDRPDAWFSQIQPWLHSNVTSPGSARTLRITIDAADAVAEVSESNNSIELGRPIPNLKIENAVFERSRLFFRIKNRPYRSFFATSGFTVGFTWMTAEGDPIPGANFDWRQAEILTSVNSPWEVNIINQGDFAFDTTNGAYNIGPVWDFLTTNVSPEAKILQVVVDYNDEIAETNERDNFVNLPRPLVDYRASPYPNSRFYQTTSGFIYNTIEYTPMNIGNGQIRQYDDEDVMVKVAFQWTNGAVNPSLIGSPYEVDYGLAHEIPDRYHYDWPGVRRIITERGYNRELQTWLNEPSSGATHLKVTIDSGGDVLESREDNNSAYYAIPGLQRIYIPPGITFVPTQQPLPPTQAPAQVIQTPTSLPTIPYTKLSPTPFPINPQSPPAPINTPTPTPVTIEFKKIPSILKKVKGIFTVIPARKPSFAEKFITNIRYILLEF